ncbi:MAG: class I SAM-dependent methyltransferase [Gaiellales bacterium]
MSDYREINGAYWDERVAAHAASPDYGLERFADDPTFLSDVVRFDIPRLGEIRGLDTVHLQCHIGTDTVSLARLGARVTGLDISAPALEVGRQLATAAGVDVRFVQSELYSAAAVLGEGAFDLVFTGIGALCWIPDIRAWADLVAALLRPGGRLHIREGHPMLWALADARVDGLLVVDLPYFERPEPIVWDEDGTYVETDIVFSQNLTHEWNHGLGEIVSALLANGMQITMLEEHDSVPWEAFPGQMRDAGGGEWRIADRPERLAHSYTLQAVKPR